MQWQATVSLSGFTVTSWFSALSRVGSAANWCSERPWYWNRHCGLTLSDLYWYWLKCKMTPSGAQSVAACINDAARLSPDWSDLTVITAYCCFSAARSSKCSRECCSRSLLGTFDWTTPSNDRQRGGWASFSRRATIIRAYGLFDLLFDCINTS